MRRSLIIIILVGLATTGLIALAGCGDDDPPPAASSSSGSGGIDSGPSTTPPDATPAQIALCEGIVQLGAPLEEVAVAGEPPPPLGGAIVPGTYVLKELNSFVGAPTFPDGGPDAEPGCCDEPIGLGATGRYARGTIYVTDTTIRFIQSSGTDLNALPADAPSAIAFKVNEASKALEITSQCPTPDKKSVMSYSAVGSGLALVVDATHRELYVRQ